MKLASYRGRLSLLRSFHKLKIKLMGKDSLNPVPYIISDITLFTQLNFLHWCAPCTAIL